MKRISDWPPFSYLHERKKLISERELIAYYDDDVYKDVINFSQQVLHFLRTDLNDWKGVPHYIEDKDGYLVFEYYDNLEHIKFSKLMTDIKLKTAMVDFLSEMYHQIKDSKFVFNDNEYYFMPVNIWLQNYMYDPNTYKIKMIDVDSFEVVEADEIEDIFKIHYNNEDYCFRK